MSNAATDITTATHIWNAGEHWSEIYEKIAKPGDSQLSEYVGKSMAMFGWYWAEDGFWSLTCGAKFAAAMMATETAGAKGSLILPARALKIILPEGLVRFRHVYIAQIPENGIFYATETPWLSDDGSDDDSGATIRAAAPTLDELLFDALDAGMAGVDPAYPEKEPLGLEDSQKREVIMIRRLIVGLLYTMQHTDNFRNKSYPTGRLLNVRMRKGPPDHRVVFVGSPIGVDVRDKVREWLGGKGKKNGPPSLQHVVRGHYKRQVIGIGRGGRKVVWVEPYWRGPEAAPILVHPRVIGGAL